MLSTTMLAAPRNIAARRPAPAQLTVESLDSVMDDSAVAFTYCILQDDADSTCRDAQAGQRRQ
ncbi:hypothetical protein ACFY8O_25140 [Streptomyces argenteolus]|uniref:Uncharacterized protein n=1 Tax=Streptomyces argenteolus TaxID=67274 RepID=A0ABW6XBR5_9ACTN